MRQSYLGVNRWRASTFLSSIGGELIAEFLGTMVLILLGDGAVALVLGAGNGVFNANPLFNNWVVVALGWGLAVTFGVYIAGAVSGAHINPAVTLAFALRRDFPWWKVVPYWLAQIAGAYVGAAIVYFNYSGLLHTFESKFRIVRGVTGINDLSSPAVTEAKIFFTLPQPFVSVPAAFADQVLGTALLVGLIFAVVDLLNQPVQSNLAPFIIGLIVVAVGLSFGLNAGFAINPARDLGPRLLALTVGFGRLAIPGPMGYVWVPIVGPLIGGSAGALLYDLGVHAVLVARRERASRAVEERGATVRERPDMIEGEIEERGRTVRERSEGEIEEPGRTVRQT
jgi:glycerol uptake facilitator protein